MTIRFWFASLALALTLVTVPAEAAWRGYVNREVGFSFNAPGEVKADKAAYRNGNAGNLPATIFRSTEDNIEYKVTVADFGRMAEADVIKAATANLQGGGRKILADAEARVDTHYGRKMTVDLPNNGGRAMGAIYYKNGHLIQLEVTVLPANGDYGTPDMGRFTDSVAFTDGREGPDAIEVKMQK